MSLRALAGSFPRITRLAISLLVLLGLGCGNDPPPPVDAGGCQYCNCMCETCGADERCIGNEHYDDGDHDGCRKKSITETSRGIEKNCLYALQHNRLSPDFKSALTYAHGDLTPL